MFSQTKEMLSGVEGHTQLVQSNMCVCVCVLGKMNQWYMYSRHEVRVVGGAILCLGGWNWS